MNMPFVSEQRKTYAEKFICDAAGFYRSKKGSFKVFTSVWLEKNVDVVKEETFNVSVWGILGLVVGSTVLWGRIPEVVADMISFSLPSFFLLSGAAVGLISLLAGRHISQKYAAAGDMLMKGSLHGSSLLAGIFLSVLFVGSLSNLEVPTIFFFILFWGVLQIICLMICAVFCLGFAGAYKAFPPKPGHKILLFLLVTALLSAAYCILSM